MDAKRSTVLVQGLIAGLVGYATVGLGFAAANLASGRPAFATLELLGRELFGTGAESVGAMIALNGAHLLAFLVLGLGAAWLAHAVDERPAFWYVLTMVGVAVFLYGLALVEILAAGVADALPAWDLAVVSLLAAAAMAAYLLLAHPGIWGRIATADGSGRITGS